MSKDLYTYSDVLVSMIAAAVSMIAATFSGIFIFLDSHAGFFGSLAGIFSISYAARKWYILEKKLKKSMEKSNDE